MLNPRRLRNISSLVQKNSLSVDPPPAGSLFWTMWNSCTAIENNALKTPFNVKIGAGTLDPTDYGAFNVSDAYYCFNGAQNYLDADSRVVNDPVLQSFLYSKYQSYQTYNEEFPQIWHVRDARGVVPLDICKEYSAYEANICSHYDPIYCIPLMLPCEHLWAWIAQQQFPPQQNNLYKDWIINNNSNDSAYSLGNFLTKYQDSIDQNLATQIYTQAMTYEYGNFLAASQSN